METLGKLKHQNSAYDICNVADEEVHFSRHMLELHHPFCSLQSQDSSATGASGGSPRHVKLGPTQSNMSNFSDVNLNYHQRDPVTATNSNTILPSEHDEQAKSSRLLQSIGTRLRRSSTGFINAPRLVGHYLLGITIQNWSEFLNTSRMMKAPTNRNQLSRRIFANLNYFQGNYLCVSLVLVIYCILTSPLLLLAIIGYFFALYLVTSRSASGRPLLLFGLFKPNIQQQYSFITLISLPLLWIAGAPSAVFWVIGASFVVIGLHATMYHNDQSFPVNSEQNQQKLDYCPSLESPYLNNSVRYYNHYSQMQPHRYIPVPAQSSNSSPVQPNSKSYSLTNWMPFVGVHQKTPSNVSPRAPDVMVISNDYAGLGRVYEV